MLQLICLGFLLGTFILVGKVTLDDKDFCSWNVANATVSGDLTVYDYEYECSTNTKTTNTSFYTMITWLIRCVVIYIVFFFFYDVVKRTFGWFGGKKRGE
jgi:hypothetical protein